jgi:hypothetical protein
MPSPFPGMNPYLERADQWQDFHTSFLTYVREALKPQVEANYVVHVEDHVFIHEMPRERWRSIGRPDVTLARRPDAGAALAAPVVEAGDEVELFITHDEVAQHYLEIRDRRNREVVTVVDLLSPSNKAPGSDRQQYLRKRDRSLLSGAHLVEIDLLRGGPRLPIEEGPPPACDYYVLVSRAQQRPKAWLRRIALQKQLPTIPIPLRPEDGDARLDLQAILNRVYDTGTYEAEVYDSPPEPPLSTDDAAWAAQFVPSRPE